MEKKKGKDRESMFGRIDDDYDEENMDDIQTINASHLSREEIERIIEEEEARMMAETNKNLKPNWKPGLRKRYLVSGIKEEEFEYEMFPERFTARWTHLDRRCGALALKVGMMPVFDAWGVRHPCTVLHLDRNMVLGHRTMEKNGYMAVQVAAGERKRKNVGKCRMGQYADMLDACGYEHPPYVVREFRITDEAHLLPLHSQIHARHFVPGQNVDISGISKGKGFQGAMKRHNFGGLSASHGNSLSHRVHGSTGSCQDPGRVFKGKRMAGHMGCERVTTQNQRIVKIDRGRNLIYVLGQVPGNSGTFVEVKDAVKKPLWLTDKVAGKVDRPPLPTFAYDPAIDGTGLPGFDEFMPMPEKDPFIPDDTADAA